jgi:hypothetical protein
VRTYGRIRAKAVLNGVHASQVKARRDASIVEFEEYATEREKTKKSRRKKVRAPLLVQVPSLFF